MKTLLKSSDFNGFNHISWHIRWFTSQMRYNNLLFRNFIRFPVIIKILLKHFYHSLAVKIQTILWLMKHQWMHDSVSSSSDKQALFAVHNNDSSIYCMHNYLYITVLSCLMVLKQEWKQGFSELFFYYASKGLMIQALLTSEYLLSFWLNNL